MESIFLRDPGRRRRASPLSRELIVGAAIALLDRDGSAGLTMRRLAEGLGVTATALYWHVRTRENVLDLAFDHIFGELPLPGAAPDWRDDVRHVLTGWRAVMLRHPWAPALVGRPVLGPHVLARTEFLQAALIRGGRTGLELAVFTRLLANFVIGSALTEATAAGGDARRHITADPGAYPVLHAEGHLDAGRWNDDELFERGLEALLDQPRRG
ncbi:TetR/AcrR family transcriptional regulator [Actinoplanes sp. RD1]|uniref:TetR/AcrR family transcriptional regulator n=1 Tax=Actinoplanes sp. RD1 TaxID=3064538 RepID=UPI0027419C41|nr:TetR/AcrR family transcriptional regulator C-terminal domain-containing protein [Actinoplanes sp. RD1]